MRLDDSVVCPKPRRLRTSFPDQTRPQRFSCFSYQNEISESKAGMDIFDIILTKGSYGAEKSGMQAASSPPFFSGSPPSRVSNPLVQDAQFINLKITPLSPSPSSAHAGGGCARVNLGNKPAPIRVEGFNPLSRDRRHRNISAVA